VSVEIADTCLLTDPLLRGHLLGLLRRRSPLAPLGRAENPDAILISHLHRDHLDLPTLRRFPATTPIVAPRGAARFLGRRGFGEVVELSPGESTPIGDLVVRAVPARHFPSRRSLSARVGSLGYVIEGGPRIYFAGDTELFDEMDQIAGGLELALLPVWGWGPRLGPWHLDPATAADALALLEPRVAVPIHWGTYTVLGSTRLWPWINTQPGKRFAEQAALKAPGVDVRVLDAGESVELGGT
jgi:L-ascorbate metabolism protein UlaG (beta-lactamase superfamily)